MDRAENFERWFTRLGTHPEQAAAKLRHPVAALKDSGVELYVRVLSELDGAVFADFGDLHLFWAAHADAQVITIQKPSRGDVAQYQVIAFSSCDAAFGIRKREGLTYDVYELSFMDVVVVGTPGVLSSARGRLVIHHGDGTPADPLRVKPLRAPYEPS